MSRDLRYRLPAMEAVGYQKGVLHQSLSAIFNECIGLPFNEVKKTLGKRVEKVVMDLTGILVKNDLENARYINAWVMMQLFDKNSSTIPDHLGVIFPDKDRKEFIKKHGDGSVGYLNLDKSYFSGVFSEIPFEVFLTQGLFNGKLSGGEVASIYIHELGHCASFLEHLGTIAHTNRVLGWLTQELLNPNNTVEYKYRIMDDSGLDLDPDTREALVKQGDKNTIPVTLYREYLGKQRKLLGKGSYDNTTFEMMADQFVSRHGGGKDLVSALGKMTWRWFSDSGPAIPFIMAQVFTLFRLIATTIMLPGIGLLVVAAIVMLTMGEQRYDKMEARIRRVYQDMVNGLKQTDLDKDTVEKMLSELDQVKLVMDQWQDRRSAIEWLCTTLVPAWRRRHTQLEFQQDLERLANNGLFISAQRFSTL